MSKSRVSVQAENYARVIVRQIADNFTALDSSVKNCKKLTEAFREYKEAKGQSRWSEFIFAKNLDEYIGYVKDVEDETGLSLCDGYRTVEPLAVGLFGEWGSGKTHQLKLIRQYLKYPPGETSFPKNTIPVFFNAWRFEKEEHMIIPLFQTLLRAVEDYESSLAEKAGKSYKRVSLYLKFGLLSLYKGLKIPSDPKSFLKSITDADYKKAIDEIIDSSKISDEVKKRANEAIVGEQSLSQLIKADQLESIYLNIPQWIEKITLFEEVNFVFLIDDLDRCLPENTLKMLESIKLFLDVPSCAFVLAVDDDVVERGVVHHYRDYLSIYHSKDTESAKGVLQQDLPITGHEYLEKVIQLPIRLPVINVEDAREFLASHSQKWIGIVERRNEAKRSGNIGENENTLKESERLLGFFADTVPSKPRKLIRTARLFETKLLLLDELLDKVDMLFVAKLTLLELFAPELLRFIQNNGYGLVFNTLCRFRGVLYLMQADKEGQDNKAEEKYLNSLLDSKEIRDYIDKSPEDEKNRGFTTKEKIVFKKALQIIEKHEKNRVAFDLDTIFEERYDTEKLRLIVEMQEPKERREISSHAQTFSDDLMLRLFRSGDVDAWKDALAEHDAMISGPQLEELIKEAEKEEESTLHDLPFITDPEWVAAVAAYVNEDEYITLLKASHDARFKKVDNRFEIDSFQMTFAEYDKYCDMRGKEKAEDHGWGRGRRPVINVSWSDAKEYITWLNEKKIGEYRLLKEKEWELACNNGKALKNKKPFWHFGNKESELKEYAWYRENSGGKTHPVAELKANALGLYDMHGNVWEWCEDWSDSEKKYRVLRGGSWLDFAGDSRSAFRNSGGPGNRNNYFGFRLLRTLPF